MKAYIAEKISNCVKILAGDSQVLYVALSTMIKEVYDNEYDTMLKRLVRGQLLNIWRIYNDQ